MTQNEAIAYVGLAMNASAIIWGAAKLSSAVDHLKDLVSEIRTVTIPEIKELAISVSDAVHNLKARVYVIESRLDVKYRAEDEIDG